MRESIQFIQDNALFLALAVSFLFYCFMYRINRRSEKTAKKYNEKGAAFSIYNHRFGFAYNAKKLQKPVIPIAFRQSSHGPYAELVYADGQTTAPVQYVRDLIRCPEYDMVPRVKSEGDLIAIMRGLIDRARDQAKRYGQDNEFQMAYAATMHADELEGRLKLFMDGSPTAWPNHAATGGNMPAPKPVLVGE